MTDEAILREQFLAQLGASVRDGSFVRLTLGKPRGADATLRNLFARPVEVRGAPHLSLVWRHERQDITKNFPPEDALTTLAPLIGADFHSAHLFTTTRLAQLEYNKKGEPRLTYGPAGEEKPDPAHDRPKQRLLTGESQPWLQALGVTTSTGSVREGMADKHRQIHKFVEILSHLAADAALPSHRPLEIADMGCGKGYLTFATSDYFNLVAARAAHVRGIEARPELVELCNRLARETGRARLSFLPGTIESAAFATLDVLIALHACDTATDDAIAKGVQAGAALIVVAPCCQKELRAQLHPAPVLAPALAHGIFAERHAEFATDALRALLLEWAGYDTKVFEFISTEHTAKNIMIAATKRAGPARTEADARKVRELAAFYGVKTQALARQLYFDLGQ
ncbi:MAG: SAM-dependent methyltransferase [Lacunisphaera sp.]|nr:SAM-dependent methyltransferase [Lacunisphaera sp.]